MTILKDLPLAAVNANSKMLKSSERANGPSSSRDLLFRVVEAKGTSPAIVRGQAGFAQAGEPGLVESPVQQSPHYGGCGASPLSSCPVLVLSHRLLRE